MGISERFALTAISDLSLTDEDLEKFGYIIQVIYDNDLSNSLLLKELHLKFIDNLPAYDVRKRRISKGSGESVS